VDDSVNDPEPAVRELALRHPVGVTPITAGEGALAAALPALAEQVAGRTLFVITSPVVWELHGAALAPLTRGGPARRVAVLEVPDGERAKIVETAHELWQRMLDEGGKRDSFLLTLGGGSVGDLGGFVAGCFLRGIAYAQVPTTLLAQVDAAIGGKTGIDLTGGKNAVGLFHHPRAVVLDPGFLATLPRRELAAGLVEVVKMAFLLDPPLLSRAERDLPRLLAADPAALGPVVAGGAAAKVRVVERDPTERGERMLLNFGHTLGHAIEASLGYQGLSHGEAVAYGLLFALRLAVRRGLDPAAAARLRGFLERLPLAPLPPLAAEPLAALLGRDKKAREGGLAWVLPAALGEGRVVHDVSAEEVAVELAAFLPDPWGGAG
jgi:3-dehydroquinate synthase